MDDILDIEDLKQFIAATVSQSEARLRDEIERMVSTSEAGLRSELREEIDSLRSEMRDGFVGVADSFEVLHKQLTEGDTDVDGEIHWLQKRAKQHDEALARHEERLRALEGPTPSAA
jgi:hypothetical protein